MSQSLADFVTSLSCPVCRFRQVAAWPSAVEVSIPLYVLEGGFCRTCQTWLSTKSGVVANGSLTFRLKEPLLPASLAQCGITVKE